MKKIILILVLFFINYFAIAQVDAVFWNPHMVQLAESNSIKGWLRVQPNK